MRMYSAAPKRLKIREDALNSMHRIFGSPDVDGIRPQINTPEKIFSLAFFPPESLQSC